MGQYYTIANVDKKEYITPWDFGGFAKLMEFAYPDNPSTITAALCILLADGNGRGSGDLHSDNPIIGSWKYNRIVVCGDYADPNPEFSITDNVYHVARESYRNISIDVLLAMADDAQYAHSEAQHLLENYQTVYSTPFVVMANAHKARQYGAGENPYPKLAVRAELFFGKLYPDKDADYFKVINGIAKHNPTMDKTIQEYEDGCTELVDDRTAKQIKAIEEEMAQLKLQYDILKNLSV